MAFMYLVYEAGLIADAALILLLLFITGVMAAMNTLTLPGIAGGSVPARGCEYPHL